jgi:hypothetical protein
MKEDSFCQMLDSNPMQGQHDQFPDYQVLLGNPIRKLILGQESVVDSMEKRQPS